MVLVTCKRIPVITKVQRTALTLIIILSLVMAHPQDREVTLRTGPAQVMEKHTITQVRMPRARFYVHVRRYFSRVTSSMGLTTCNALSLFL